MKKLAYKALNCALLCGTCISIYAGIPAVLQISNDRKYHELLPSEGLAELLNKEAVVAGVPKGTVIRLNSLPNSSKREPRTYYDSKYPQVYLMVMREADMKIHVVRHELYHIAAGHLINGEKTKNIAWLKAKRHLWYEPTATFYETWQIKL